MKYSPDFIEITPMENIYSTALAEIKPPSVFTYYPYKPSPLTLSPDYFKPDVVINDTTV